MNYFVRQKTIQVPDSSFKLVKLYACTDETERLQGPEQHEVDFSGKKELSDPRCRELLEVVAQSNFGEGDFVLLFTFPQQKDDKTREKELSSFLSRLGWVYHGKPTYVCRSERMTARTQASTGMLMQSQPSRRQQEVVAVAPKARQGCRATVRNTRQDVHDQEQQGELCFTVFLRDRKSLSKSDGRLTDEALMKLCGNMDITFRRITRDENSLLILPDFGNSVNWFCSDNIKRSVVTVEDGVISTDDLKTFLQAKVGEDTTPVIRRMFGEWKTVHSRFTSFEYGEAGIPHIEFKLVLTNA